MSSSDKGGLSSFINVAKIYDIEGNTDLRDLNIQKSKEYFDKGKRLPGSTFMDYLDKIYTGL